MDAAFPDAAVDLEFQEPAILEPTQDETDIASTRARLEELETERSTMSGQLARLQSAASLVGTGHTVGAPITAHSKAAEKIALFRRLFAGGHCREIEFRKFVFG